MATDIERLHYYQRQYLGAADFEAQQAYLRDMRRRHNIGQHTLGIVAGLELVELPSQGAAGGVDVFILPGMAVDGYGREIFVLAPQPLDPLLFDTFLDKKHRTVYISYSQEAAQQSGAGYRVCEVADQFTRIVETFEIVAEPKQPFHDDITVGGKALVPSSFPPSPPPASIDLTIPPDESVPYQELPDDQNQPRWLIRLGSAYWDGVNRQFVSTTPDHYSEGRIYAGVVADRILAPADNLTITPREIPSDADPTKLAKIDMDAAPFAEVRGRLQADGRIIAKKDVEIHGGKLSLLDSSGADNVGTTDVPLWIQRQSPPSGSGVDLRVHIGDTSDGKAAATTRFSVGPTKDKNELAVLAVRGDNTVKIETGTLDFGSTTRQMLNLWSSDDQTHEYGIGIQSGTLYFRTDQEFYWYKGGQHVEDPSGPNPPGPAGQGGSVQLRLDYKGCLDFGKQVRQMLNLWSSDRDHHQYGIGIQDSTLYFRSDFDFCWFRRGVHADGRTDPGGGDLVMKLDSSNTLNLAGDLRVSGKTNLIHVAQQTFAKSNSTTGSNGDNPQSWHYDYSSENFVEVYAVYAVLQGFSIFNNNDNPAFDHLEHDASIGYIPQHAYVRITSAPPFNNKAVDGICFCSQSDPSQDQAVNTILFTVVVIGRTAA